METDWKKICNGKMRQNKKRKEEEEKQGQR